MSKNLYTSVNSIRKYRDKLVLAGLVGYDAGTPQKVSSIFTILPTISNFDTVVPATISNFDTVNSNSANTLNETISNFDTVFYQSNPAYILSNAKEEKTEKPITTILVKEKVKEKVKKISKRGVLMALVYPTLEDFILPIQKLVPAMGLDEVAYWYNQAIKWSNGENGGNLQYRINWCKAVNS